MNKITSNPSPEIMKQMTKSDDTPESAPEDPVSEAPTPPKQAEPAEPKLTAADMQMIHRFLMSQDEGLARRSDLTELHKRVVQMFQALSQAVGETINKKVGGDSKDLMSRIDTLEDAVNRMEGALRIEFEPVLRKAIADVMAEQAKPQRRLGRQLLWTGVVLGAGLLLGTVYSGGLSAMAQQAVSNLATIVN